MPFSWPNGRPSSCKEKLGKQNDHWSIHWYKMKDVQTAFFSITGIITFLCSINKSRFYILHIRIHYFLCLSVLTVSHNSHLKVMQLLNVDQKRHIQDKEDLIKMKLEMWLSNIYCFGRIKPKFKYRSLFDWHLISLHNKCWHWFYLCVSWLLTAGINFLFVLFKNKR